MPYQKSCRGRLRLSLAERITDLKRLIEIEKQGVYEKALSEYAESFEYVPAQTFPVQRQGYFKYALQLGHPQDEFHFYTDEAFNVKKIEYWYMDWFDGAKVTLNGRKKDVMLQVWQWMRDISAVDGEYHRANDK